MQLLLQPAWQEPEQLLGAQEVTQFPVQLLPLHPEEQLLEHVRQPPLQVPLQLLCAPQELPHPLHDVVAEPGQANNWAFILIINKHHLQCLKC